MQDEEHTLEAQKVLNQLLKEQKLPFKLNVGSLLNQGESQYRVHFFDSRMHSVEFSWQEGQSFQETFRDAVLERVGRLSGPLSDWNKELAKKETD